QSPAASLCRAITSCDVTWPNCCHLLPCAAAPTSSSRDCAHCATSPKRRLRRHDLAMEKDPITVALTGMLPFVIIAGAVLALPAAIFLLWLYRRAVLRGMSESRGGSASAVSATVADVPRSPLGVLSLGTNVAPPAPFPSPWRAALVYAAAGAAFALTLAVEWLVSTHDREIGAVKVLFLFWSFAWPAVLAVILVAAEDRVRKLWVVLGYFAVYIAL